MLLTDAGMVAKRALIKPSNCAVMLNEGKADVLATETGGASERRYATDGKVAAPNARQITARHRD
jgi:hypothetical protein